MSSILKYAGKYRRHIFTALVLISISVPIGVVPYFLISGLIGKYISEAAVMADVVRTSVLILICFTVKYILYGEGLNLSHEGAFGTLYNMRVKLQTSFSISHWARLQTAERENTRKALWKR